VTWNSNDYAALVRKMASAITCDGQGEVVLIQDCATLYAFGRAGDGTEDLAVYVLSGSLDADQGDPGFGELVAGRPALEALRALIGRELAKTPTGDAP
jgi:hypothetical protein